MSAATSPLVITGSPSGFQRKSVGRRIYDLAGNYWVGRIVKAILTIYLVVTLTFFLVRLMPGNPVESFVLNLVQTQGLTYPEAQAQAASLFSFDINAPLWKQYLDYLGNLAHGNLGISIVSTGTPVSVMVLQYLPWTLFSVGIALLISFVLGMTLGIIMAYRRDSPADHVLSTIAAFISGVPNYLLAILIVVFLGIRLHLVPFTAMRGSLSPGVSPNLSLHFIGDALFHASLPILVYVLTTVGGWMLLMKSNTTSTLGEDYVLVARARGLRDGRITTAYVGRNAMLPLVSALAISVGFIVGGSTVIEQIFVYQGIGWILGSSIVSLDYTVMQGIFLILTISVVISNLLADLIYGKLDPRVRIAGSQ